MLEIKVVGPGCKNCEKLYDLCSEVVEENSWQAKITKVTELNEFADLGIFVTPGLVVNDDVLFQGKLPTKATLENRLKKVLK